MDSRFYVTLEAARLLKEKGYDEKVEYMYDDNILTSIDVLTNSQIDRYYRNMYGVEFYGAPTKSEAIDWLKSKGIVISVEYINGLWDCQIYSFVDGIILHGKALPMVYDVVNFQTRLEAEEAAIIKACELL